jgi:hypothetical protein
MAPPSLLAHLDSAKDSTALSLAYASVGDEGCNSIARYMRENVLLKTVDLRGNNIRADGLVVLSHALRSSGNVTSFCLKWNHVGSHERGLRALNDVLKGNQGVTHLDLRNNKIGPECGALFGEMLKENNALSHLDLSWNDLGIEGGKALLNGIQANHSLIDCQLSGNRIAEDTLHAIAFILRRNRQSAPLSNATMKEGREASPQRSPPSGGQGYSGGVENLTSPRGQATRPTGPSLSRGHPAGNATGNKREVSTCPGRGPRFEAPPEGTKLHKCRRRPVLW